MSGASADDIGTCLQQVINTYWYGSASPSAMIGVTIVDELGSSSPNIADNGAIMTVDDNTFQQEIYICSFRWLALLLLATGVMFCAAIVILCFSLLIRGPVVLGYFSTSLRESPYVSTSRSGGTLDGFNRARYLGKMKVKMVDVEEENPEGYIANTEDAGREGNSLSHGRYYNYNYAISGIHL